MELLGFTPIQIKCGKGQLVLVKILYYGQFRNNQTLKNLLWVGLFFFTEYETTQTKTNSELAKSNLM